MSWFSRIVTLLALLVAVAGAGPLYGADAGSAAEFPYRHGAFDFIVVWNSTPADKGIVIEGRLKNVRYAYVDDLELTVALRRGDKSLAKETVFLTPQPVRNGEARPFSLKLGNVARLPGDLFQFTIKYRVDEGRDERFTWLSSFVVDASTGTAVEEEGKAPAPSY